MHRHISIFTTVALCFGASAPGADAAEEAKGTIRAQVSGLRNGKGRVACLLFAKNDGWPGEVKKAVAKAESSIVGSGDALQGTCEFKDVPYGVYAVATMHDEDSNGKMKQNLLGVPKEGYGASNNPDNGFMSGPPYDKSTFQLAQPTRSLRIKLRY